MSANATDTKAILKEIYPTVSAKLKTNSNKYKQCVGRFINTRADVLYANAPYTKMYFAEDDIADYYKSTGIDRKIVGAGINNTYYYPIKAFNPRYAKDDFVVSMICTIRHYLLAKDKKNLELSLIYLAASGKYYTSIFSRSFPNFDPAPHVMEMVVTHECSNKFDIVREGNIIGTLRSIATTWLETYDDLFKRFTDADCVYLIQQLHNRIGSFMNNIAELYYKAVENGGAYITYDSDNVSEDSFRLAESDSFLLEKIVVATINRINNKGLDFRICKLAANTTVMVNELKGILDSVFNNSDSIPIIIELVTLIVANYFTYTSDKKKTVQTADFITYTITPKPNTKDENLLRQKDVLVVLLMANSESFNRRRNRVATEQAYFKSILVYFALLIQECGS